MWLSTMARVRRAITQRPAAPFTAHDLYACGPADRVARCLQRLARQGVIRRVARGTYHP